MTKKQTQIGMKRLESNEDMFIEHELYHTECEYPNNCSSCANEEVIRSKEVSKSIKFSNR